MIRQRFWRMRSRSYGHRSTILRVCLTVALPLQALLVCEWLIPILNPVFDAPFIAAVALTSWICGPAFGIGAALFSALLLDYFFLPPLHSLAPGDTQTMVRFFVFLGANAIIIGLIANLFRTQAALLDSEQTSRSMAELIPFGLWMSDERGNMVQLSESFLRTFQRNIDECRGLKWLELLDDSQRDQVRADWLQCMRSGYFWDYEYHMRAPGGQEYVVLSRGVPVSNRLGRGRSWIGIHLDITEREHLTEQRVQQGRDIARFNAELEQFAYVSAHDLQEPLRMIASYLQLLSRRYKGKLDADADTFIEYAVDGADRLRSLLQDLLQLQQVGKRGRPQTELSLTRATEQAIANLGLTADEAAIHIGDLPSLPCDEQDFIRLFENLIGNAVKYARDGVKPEIHISAQRDAGGWTVSIRDNGIGIDPAFLDRIFNIFQRLHARSKYPGTGIGLAICKKIVEVHGGRIWAESEPGRGATFSFSIPC